MPKTISGAVGRGGRNFPPVDVMTVQYLLNCVPAGQGGPTPELVIDGIVGPKTISAIEKFQRSLGGACDGRVDPGGNTLRALQGRDPYPQQALPVGGQKGGQSAGKGYPPGKSSGPQQPGFPGETGAPQQPGFPGKTGGAQQPGFPGKTGGSQQPGFPGKTGGAQQPGFPGKTGGSMPGKPGGGPPGKGFGGKPF